MRKVLIRAFDCLLLKISPPVGWGEKKELHGLRRTIHKAVYLTYLRVCYGKNQRQERR